MTFEALCGFSSLLCMMPMKKSNFLPYMTDCEVFHGSWRCPASRSIIYIKRKENYKAGFFLFSRLKSLEFPAILVYNGKRLILLLFRTAETHPERIADAFMDNTEKKKKLKRRRRLTNLLLLFIFLIGVGLLAYPTVSDYWNSFHQSRAIISYVEKVANLDTEKYEKIMNSAMDYNRDLAKKGNQWLMTDEDLERYNQELNVDGTGNLGIISIPKLNLELPLYHGTSESVLQTSVGHIEGSSLPVGSPHLNEEDFDDIPFASHCLLSGHRGLPSARLFSDLNNLEVGDVFYLNIMDQTLTYQVTDIFVVLPSDSSKSMLEPGLDLCTLITCTPYGINTHRLLVRGRRVMNEKKILDVRISSDAVKIDSVVVAPFIAAPVLLLLVIWALIITSGSKRYY